MKHQRKTNQKKMEITERTTGRWTRSTPLFIFLGVDLLKLLKISTKIFLYITMWEKNTLPCKRYFWRYPEMIGFAEKLGVEVSWDKYHQIVVRDYVSGAMENTTAVVTVNKRIK